MYNVSALLLDEAFLKSKMALSHWLGPWFIQQLVLPYKSWCVVTEVVLFSLVAFKTLIFHKVM